MERSKNDLGGKRKKCEMVLTNEFYFRSVERDVFPSREVAEAEITVAIREKADLFKYLEEENKIYCIFTSYRNDLLEAPIVEEIDNETNKVIWIVKTIYRITEGKKRIRERYIREKEKRDNYGKES